MSDQSFNPTGDERQRSAALVREVLERTGNIIAQPAETSQQKCFKRMAIVNKAVALAIHDYHEKHPVASDRNELIKLVMRTYMLEFSRWQFDDVIELLTMQQSMICLKHFGYE